MANFDEPAGKRLKKEGKVLMDRTVCHPCLPQTDHQNKDSAGVYTFVIGADPQLGMKNCNRDWEAEMEYSERAVTYINQMTTRPAFVCMCGDLVDMEDMAYTGTFGTKLECLDVQKQQYEDFSRIFSKLDVDIPLLCLCGNHDVGNRPTLESITRFTDRFGDDYFAFWCNHAYHICLNTNLHNDPSGAQDLYDAQHEWLKGRLEHARAEKAERIFLFGHHPWFLYDENEILDEMKGVNVLPHRDEYVAVPDKYFSIRSSIRHQILDLCKEYKVNACFAGHFHQNLISHTSWGMPMIVTAGICNYNLESTAKDLSRPENRTEGAGVRIVEVSGVPPASVNASASSEKKDTDEKREEEVGDKNSDEPSNHFLGFTHRYELV
mmetsp:Transcript_15712/g.26198  ORF Transcript_15712/g.26198 Transcript_15712/m.26198 type:complete len:379 (+) Transcript_15712:52-1188(+)